MSFVHSASNHKDGDGRRDFVSREYETPRFGFEGVVEELPPAVEDSDPSMEYDLHANC